MFSHFVRLGGNLHSGLYEMSHGQYEGKGEWLAVVIAACICFSAKIYTSTKTRVDKPRHCNNFTGIVTAPLAPCAKFKSLVLCMIRRDINVRYQNHQSHDFSSIKILLLV